MKKLFIIVSVAAMIAAGGNGTSEDSNNSLQIIGDGFQYKLKAPSPIFASGDRFTQITIDSFGLTGVEGYPQLPVRYFKAAIPENASATLKILKSRVTEFPGVRIAPVPSLSLTRRPEDIPERIYDHGNRSTQILSDRIEVSETEVSHIENEEIYSSVSPYPTSPVRLGKTGYMRRQKYVEIIFYPILYYPAEQRALFFDEIDIEVQFHYTGAAPYDTSYSYTLEPSFEPMYQQSFINYEQGKSFRIEKGLKQTIADPDSLSGGRELSAENYGLPGSSLDSITASSIYKLKISQDGIYRLDYNYILNNASGLLAEDPRTFKLMNRGVELPIYVGGEGDGSFDVTDYIEFYGQALINETQTLLNYDFIDPRPSIYQDNDFTDINVYFLTAEAPSTERERIPEVNGNPVSGYTIADDFLDEVHAEVENTYLPLGENDPWYWGPRIRSTDLGDNDGDGKVDEDPLDGIDNDSDGSTDEDRPPYKDVLMDLPGISSLTHTAEVSARIRGTTFYSDVDPDHQTAATVNGYSATRDEQTWDGETIFTHVKSFDQTYLTAATTVRIEAMQVPSVSLNEVILDHVTLKYYRLLQAESNAILFQYDNGDYQFDVDNFSDATLSIYEITDRVTGSDVVSASKIINPGITGSGSYTASFEVLNDTGLPPGDKRYFALSTVSTMLTPDSCTLDTISDLRDTLNEADIVVIGTPDTIIDGTTDQPIQTLQDLLDFRYSDRSLTSKIVMMEDICDEFNDGLFDPNAIRYFLEYAFNNWTTPPSYLFIIGDGTYDYKNNYGQVDFENYVPTQIMFQQSELLQYYSADHWLACFLGSDQAADIHLGRISSRTDEESDDALSKILLYEDTPPSGSWKSHDIMIADEGKNGNADETKEFEDVKDRQINEYLASPHSFQKIYYAKSPYDGWNNTLCRDDIVAAINGGAVVLNYVGHGNFTTWSNDGIFHVSDISSLTNINHYPWLIASNCLSGGFHHATVTAIGEEFVNAADKGTVATFAPSGISYTFIGQTVENLIYDDIYGPHKEREVAVIISHVRDDLYSRESIFDLQSYTYLGDPLLDLVIPRPEPPTNPVATAGHEIVQLTWTRSVDDPVTTGSGYNIYRTTDLSKEYAKINSALVENDYYDDTAVENMTTYYYTITFEDSDGFESPYSNFNTDCDPDGTNDGPDCLNATPENPDPPTDPTGFDASDPETGWKLDLTWNGNGESDLMGYTLYWGTTSRFDPQFTGYDNSEWLGDKTSYTLLGLENGTVYYLCVTATNTSHRESGYSNEDSEKPDYVPGLKPPKAITDLMVTHPTGTNDLELTWTVPTVDIYGDPETIKEVKIYRDTVPDFIPSLSNQITDPPLPPGTTSYTDSGAYASTDDYYYLVQTIDTDDNPSGIGREVPAAIEDMIVEKSLITPNIILSWSAITTDFSGDPTLIDHYDLYGRDTKFSREDIKNGAVPLIQGNITTTSVEINPAAGERYYSVIVVDNRGCESPY